MIITQRLYIIPQTMEEHEILQLDKKYEKQTSYIDNKLISYFTNRESDATLIRSYTNKIKQLYSFQSLNIKGQTSIEIIKYISNLKIKPTIIIDLRTNKKIKESFTSGDLKYIASNLNLMHYRIPELSISSKHEAGYKTLSSLLIHKKMLIIGTNDKTLNKVQEYLNNKTEVI